MTAGKILDNFYIKVLLKGWGICCLIWSFMILQFWWGNHDWEFLKYGILLENGFFEARYSQHLPTVMFLEGQILPVFGYIFAMFFLALLGVLIARYLDCPKEEVKYLYFISMIAVLPHTAILFYYVFILVPLLFWGSFGVGILFLLEPPFKLWKFIMGGIGFLVLLGSYPPNMALIFTLFVGKRILTYVSKQQSFKEIFYNSVFFVGILGVTFGIYKVFQYILVYLKLLNPVMYNISMRSLGDMFLQLPVELEKFFMFFADMHHSLGIFYVLFFVLLLVGGFYYIFYFAPNRFVVGVLLVALFLASRFVFIISEGAYDAKFRVGWWGEIGLIAFGLAALFRCNNLAIRNFVFLCCSIFFIIFFRTDFEIQKVRYFGFWGERLFQKRVESRLFDYPLFDIDRNYLTLNLGYPDVHRHFCYKNCYGFNNEILDATVLPADFGQFIFWDEQRQPVNARYGFWVKKLWFVGRGDLNKMRPYDVDSEVKSIRQWMYSGSKIYPSASSIYMDKQFIIFNFDEQLFNANREYILNSFYQK